MGLVSALLRVGNPKLPGIEPVEAKALCDTGALHLFIPEHVALQLKLETIEHQVVILADGSRRSVPYVGPVEVRFKNRVGFMGALVLGNQVLLGAIPMEEMDLVVIPRSRRVDVNPENPNVASSIVKSMPRAAA
jgi:clan AA aspartic protease